MQPQIEIAAKVISNILSFENEELLKYEIVYPHINHESSRAGAASLYHKKQAEDFEKIIKSTILPTAKKEKEALKEGFHPFKVYASFHVMYNSGDHLSFFSDTFYNLGYSGEKMLRFSHTYNTKSWKKIPLPDLFQRGADYNSVINALLFEKIKEESAQNPGLFFANWQEIIKTARPSFYMADDGLAVYYKQNEICQKIAGIPTYLLPYENLRGILASPNL